MKQKQPTELTIIQKAYDLIQWYIPALTKLPREYKFTLGERMMNGLFEVLNDLINARYSKQKLQQLQAVNVRLEKLRYQTRMLLDFKLMGAQRFGYASKLINEVGEEKRFIIVGASHRGRLLIVAYTERG